MRYGIGVKQARVQMKIDNTAPETYVLTELDGLDPVTVYVTNYEAGQGKIVIQCYDKAWTAYWGAMGCQTLQEFFVRCNNDYILNRFLTTATQTDFDAINAKAQEQGIDLCVTSDVEVAIQSKLIEGIYGDNDHWMNLIPTCTTSDYKYAGRIVDAVKAAFNQDK